jgi:hypothetical protein
VGGGKKKKKGKKERKKAWPRRITARWKGESGQESGQESGPVQLKVSLLSKSQGSL